MIYAIIIHFFAAGGVVEHTGQVITASEIFIEVLPILIMIIIDIVIIKIRFLFTVVDTCNYEENFNVLSK